MWILRSTSTNIDETERILRVTPGTSRTIGRGPRADFVIDTSLLSRVHCRLEATETELTVEDLKSTNGTFVNGRRVSRTPLQNGDRLRLGRLELVVSKE
jgi:pSer/pThr/pTyr-binding forkhead associated (FHA) protein